MLHHSKTTCLFKLPRAIVPRIAIGSTALAGALTGAAVSPYGKASQRSVLGLSACNALAPNIECARLQLPAHKINNPRLIEPIFGLNDLERGSVLPGHFNHPANVITGKSICEITQKYARSADSGFILLLIRGANVMSSHCPSIFSRVPLCAAP